MRFAKATALAATLCLAFTAACGEEDEPNNNPPAGNTNDNNDNGNDNNNDNGNGSNMDPNLVGLVADTADLSSLLTVITYIDTNGTQADSADLATLLSGTGPFTVFAPNNDAFAAALDLDSDDDFDTDDVAALETALGGAAATADALYLVVANHAASGRLESTDLTNGQEIDTVAGTYDADGFGVLVDTTSGVVVSGSYDAAPATVVTPNVSASNGVAHIIDQIIIDEATAAALGLEEDDENLVELVAATADLSSLLTVITYIDANGSQEDSADLATLLSGTGPFTVFTPNNAAFAAALDLDADDDFDTDDVAALETALGGAQNTADALYLVVANHAANGRVLSTDLSDGQQIDTLAGMFDPDVYGISVDTSSGVV
ncbi:MAG: fasciclin domain-containing protein, partial [Myxococcota bacterium]